MNIRNIFILRFLAAMLLCVVAASCSQNELPIGSGETLPPGKYPLLFTASIDEMTSRADTSDPWGDGDEIAVQIGEYPGIGRYMLNVDGSVKASDDPLSWPFENGFVKAWYPYVKIGSTLNKNIVDQTEGYHDIDFLYAITDKEENFKNTVNLRFHHQMAKVSCRLTKGEGVTDEDMATAKVSFSGTTSVSFKEGTVAGTDFEWITPLSNESALLVPQDMSGKEFIKVDMTVTVNGVEIPKTLIYSPSEANLKAGTHYVYNVTVNKDRLVVDPITAAWDDNVESGDANVAVFKVIMPGDLPEGYRNKLTFTDNVLNQDKYRNGTESYLTVKGNDFKIFYPATVETLVRLLIDEGKEVDKGPDNIDIPLVELENKDDLLYETSFHLRSSELTLKWDYLFFDPEVGDYYYSDGTWSSFYYPNKDCIGIVVKVGVGSGDTDNEDWLLEGEQISGYVLALKEHEQTRWIVGKNSITSTELSGLSKAVNTYDGYRNTKVLRNLFSEEAGVTTVADMVLKMDIPAPGSSSGWYVPSANQLMDLLYTKDAYNSYKNNLKTCGGDDIPIGTASKDLYWSSTPYTTSSAFAAYRNSDKSVRQSKTMTTAYRLRPILSFTKPRKNKKDE